MCEETQVFPKLNLLTNHSRIVLDMQIILPPWELQVHVTKDNSILRNVSLVTMRSKELWLVQNHATVKPDSSVAPRRWNENLHRKQKWAAKCANLKKMLESQVTFCHQGSPVSGKAWTSPQILQELKKYPRKTCGCGQPSGHLIRVLNERNVVTMEFCVFGGWWFSNINQFDIVSETHFSCDTVGHELWLATLSSLLYPRTDGLEHSHRKARYVFILSDFKK